MESITELLKQLAEKLGTTAEHLWAVLIRQAPISATVDLGLLLLSFVVGFILYRVHSWAVKEDKYDQYDPGLGITMFFVMIIWAIWVLVGLSTLEYIIAGYFNPEYWALHKVLSLVKK